MCFWTTISKVDYAQCSVSFEYPDVDINKEAKGESDVGWEKMALMLHTVVSLCVEVTVIMDKETSKARPTKQVL